MMMGITEIQGNDVRHVSNNLSAGNFFGFSPKEMEGRLFSELGFTKSGVEHWLKSLRETENSRTPVSFEYCHSTSLGLRILSVVVSLIENNSEGKARFSYIAQDITEERKAETELRESKRLLEERVKERAAAFESSQRNFQRMFGMAPVAVAVALSPSGILVHVNDVWTKLTGYSEDEAIGKSTVELGLFYELSDRERLYEQFNSTGRVRNADVLSRTKSGELRSILVNMDVIEMEGAAEGQMYVVATLEDVTEIRKGELQLKESEARFRLLSQVIPQLVWTADSNGKLDYFNERWFEYLGINAVDVQLDIEGGVAFVHPEDRRAVVERCKEGFEKGTEIEIEFRLKSKEGRYDWFLGRAVPLRNAQGEIIKWFGTNTNITEQKRIDAELRNAIRARDEFLSVASHELKTPLSSLKLLAQLAKRNRERGDVSVYSPEKVDRLIDQTERQINRLTRLVDDMLDIARIRSGKLTIQKEKFDLNILVEEVIDRLASNLNESETRVHLKKSIPIEGFWDRFRMEQVVVNLLTNSMRYGKKRPVEVTLRKIPGDPSKVRLEIQDQGIGIPPEACERIFGRFERAVDANEVSGLGLGLFITRQIVEAHDGRVWAESKGLNQGANFIIEIPI